MKQGDVIRVYWKGDGWDENQLEVIDEEEEDNYDDGEDEDELKAKYEEEDSVVEDDLVEKDEVID